MSETVQPPGVPGAVPRVEDKGDLGFGAVAATDSRRRLLNRNGTFNVRRVGLGWLEAESPYHSALGMTWPRFLGYVVLVYVSINVVFAAAFLLCGSGALVGAGPNEMGGAYWRAFFFSVETFATIGYGDISPVGFPAHMVMVTESLVALMSQALITGLLFARFSRPTAAIRFSANMVVAPYRGGRALMFRIANRRANEIIDLEARVNCSWIGNDARGTGRRFEQLALERSTVVFFPLSWTLVHPITEESPLWGSGDAELRAQDFEFLILIKGTDETFAQQVHARSSYKAGEIVWGAKFRNVFNPPDEHGILSVDVGRIDEYDRVELPH
ncbi:MAG TPA: ion channel [Gemmatimonadaceae bacterium]|nr:ion channel [Gemmatimonadaceae bacterium]